jgi:hypothetical protein
MKRESTALRCRGDRIETWLIIAAAKAASDRRRNGLNWAHLMAARPAAARLPTPSRGCPGSYAALLLPLAVFLICISAFAASSEAQQQRSDPADVGTVPVRGLLGDELRGAQIPPRRRTPEAKRLPRLPHLRLIARQWTRQAPWCTCIILRTMPEYQLEIPRRRRSHRGASFLTLLGGTAEPHQSIA